MTVRLLLGSAMLLACHPTDQAVLSSAQDLRVEKVTRLGTYPNVSALVGAVIVNDTSAVAWTRQQDLLLFSSDRPPQIIEPGGKFTMAFVTTGETPHVYGISGPQGRIVDLGLTGGRPEVTRPCALLTRAIGVVGEANTLWAILSAQGRARHEIMRVELRANSCMVQDSIPLYCRGENPSIARSGSAQPSLRAATLVRL